MMISRIMQVFAVVLMGTACYLIFRHYQGDDSCYPSKASNFLMFCANTLIFIMQNMIRNTNQALEKMRQAQREAYANSGLPAYPSRTDFLCGRSFTAAPTPRGLSMAPTDPDKVDNSPPSTEEETE